MVLDVARAERFLGWVGVVRAAEECPICFEAKRDVRTLDHWQATGDVSG